MNCTNNCNNHLPTGQDCFTTMVADSLDDIIYINDPVTYDILWLNKAACQYVQTADILGKKCYQLFQNLDAPCPFCPIPNLSHDKFYTWEHYNEKFGRYFRIKDKLITCDGTPLHMEVATDITESVLERKSIKNQLAVEQTLLRCVRTLLAEEDFSTAMEKALLLAGHLYEADRCYIFETKYDDSGREIAVNTHEWCAQGVTPQKANLQSVPLDVLSPWMTAFSNSNYVIIKDIEEIKKESPDLYDVLKPQDIKSLYVVPLKINDRLSGFIGVDNPRNSHHDLTLLFSLAYFMDNTISRTRMADELRALGLCDPLTRLGNRNAYCITCNSLAAGDMHNVGVLFIDLNNLKYLNDTYGHEKGDEFIVNISRIFASHFRSSNIFRIGGDEFVFICNEIHEDVFLHKLEKMKQDCETAYPGGISLGFIWQANPVSLDFLIHEADERMYADKKRIKGAKH